MYTNIGPNSIAEIMYRLLTKTPHPDGWGVLFAAGEAASLMAIR
jgi:predicted glutamine amidotransferase